MLCAQEPGLGAPAIAAHVKGPDQINLTWPAVADPGYGYLVEIRSASDSRFTAWTELEPIPRAGGYTCDSSIVARGARCNLSDPTGEQVHNPSNRGIPYWVTEAQYADPQDGTAAQFIAWGLKPNTAYSFRVRSYSGNASPVFSAYSNTASGTTSDYAVRYVSPAGKDANDGKGADPAHAWRTLAHGAAAIGCGQVLIVMGGNYPADEIRMTQKCSAAAKAVVLVNPGDTAAIVSQPANSGHALVLAGDYLVVDGLGVNSPGTPYGEYDAEIDGSHNALLNVEFRPPAIPSFKFGVVILGRSNLVYRSYLHDYGSPDATQNPDGGGGFLLAVLGAAENVIWSNHLTRGGHDESLCKSGCRNNRWLNNVMDGGWGQGWIAVSGSDHKAALTSPRESAAMALRMAASGDIGGAMSYFTPAKFPNEKQEDAVREAYLELRLRRVVALAAARQCAAAIQGLTNLEAEDKSLPFTSHGFGSFTKGIRVQYWVGVVESACVDQNAARKRWEVLAKATPEIASTDHAYPYMALAKLDPAEGKIQARRALGFLQRQLGTALPEYQGALLYSQGLLQTIVGRDDDAAASFQAGATAGPPGMVEYLNLEAIRMLDADRQRLEGGTDHRLAWSVMARLGTAT